jgi:hypothetical protein
MPRMVTPGWIDLCWKQSDRMDEEGYALRRHEGTKT